MKLVGEDSEFKHEKIHSFLLYDVLVFLYYVFFFFRILLRNVVFEALEVDYVYLKFCKCQDDINHIFTV